MAERGKKPTHYLFVKKKVGGVSMKVGAGWVAEWGGVSIQLNPCVVLTDRDDIYINLYKNKDNQSEPGPPINEDDVSPIGDDDVPF